MTNHDNNPNNNTNQTKGQRPEILKTSSLELRIGCLESIFVTPYNWSLIVLSFIAWFGVAYFGYYNTNFDMISSITNYVIATSLIAILIGSTKSLEGARDLTKIAIATLSLSFLSLISFKSVNPIFNNLGCLLLMPASIFGFFLLLKNLWLLSASNKQGTRGAGVMGGH
jgi:hypothetical protein